jgi:hypothetical protein
VKDDGILEVLDVSLEEARILVMGARLSVGLITQTEYDEAITNKTISTADEEHKE